MKKVHPKSKKGICRVTFALPRSMETKTAYVVGEFNGWDKHATPMKRKTDGSLSATLELAAGKSYRFRYWLDETRWENEVEADDYVPNGFGDDDSVVNT